MQYLKEHGVQTGVHYPLPIHELPAFQKETFAKSHFPNSEFVAHNGVSIPMCPTMQTQDVAYVIETVRSYFGK